jgi:SAM-dependent methyltransferase
MLRSFFVRRAVRRALQTSAVSPGLVLDIPCGTGIATREMLAGGARVVGTDVSLPMLRFARTIAATPDDRATWVCGNIERLPFRPGTVHAVLCLRFFSHLPPSRWRAVLRALAGLTSGPIIIGLPMRWSSKHWWRAFKRRIGIDAKHRPIFSREVVVAAFEDAGLEINGSLWQSPFTDTALVIARRKRPTRSGQL